MKKIIFIIILLLMFVTNTKASENDADVRLQYVPNVYINYKKNNLSYWGQFAYIYVNDTIAYCLDVKTPVITGEYTSKKEEINSLILLAGYFGYNYQNKNSLKDYMATQKLIWEYLGDDVYFTTKSEGKGDIIDVSDIELEIIYKINNHALFPLFNEEFNFRIGDKINITDHNNIVNKLLLENNSNNDINIINDKVNFKLNEKGTNYFKLTTNYIPRFENVIYEAENSQKIIKIGKIENVYNIYQYNVEGATLTLNLKDSLTKNKENTGKTSFEGNVFELYKDDLLIDTVITDEKGEYLIKDLNFGKYYLKHIKASEGYNIHNIIEISIDENNVDKKIDINLDPKKINVNITKEYGYKKLNYILKDIGINFDVYNSKNEKIKNITTDENGNCNLDLYYDDYIIVQTNNNIENLKKNTINIYVNDFNENKNIEIFDKYYKVRLNIFLREKNTKEGISNKEIRIDEKKYITNENGNIITDLLDINTYKITQEKSKDYITIDEMYININDESKLYLKNNEIFLDINIINEKKLLNIIEDNNENINTDKNEEDNKIENINTDKNEEDNKIENINKEENNIETLPYLGLNINDEKIYKNNNNNFFSYIFYSLFKY